MYRLADLALPHASGRRNAPISVDDLRTSLEAPNFTDLNIALYKHFMKVRGRDPATLRIPGLVAPATTNLEVMQLAAMWSKEVLRVSIDNATDRARNQAWLDCMGQVRAHADVKAHANATYAGNRAFWRCTSKTAVWLDVRKLRPKKWDLWWDSVGEAVVELPSTLGDVVHAVGGAGRSAVGAAGDAARSVGRGLADFFSKPVALIALVVGGAFVVPPVVRSLRK